MAPYGLSELDRRLGDVGRNPLAQQALHRLGIELHQIRQASPVERMFLLADAFAEPEDRGRSLADVYELTGRSAKDFLQILELGGDTLRDLADSAPIVDEDDIRAITRLNDALDLLGKRGRSAAGNSLGAVVKSAEGIGLLLAQAKADAVNIFDAMTGRADAGQLAARDVELKRRMGEWVASADEERDRERLAPLHTAVADLAAEYGKLAEARRQAETPPEDLLDEEIEKQLALVEELEKKEILETKIAIEKSVACEAGRHKELAGERDEQREEDDRSRAEAERRPSASARRRSPISCAPPR